MGHQYKYTWTKEWWGGLDCDGCRYGWCRGFCLWLLLELCLYFDELLGESQTRSKPHVPVQCIHIPRSFSFPTWLRFPWAGFLIFFCFRCEQMQEIYQWFWTHISPLMKSRRVSTLVLASAWSCCTKTGPINLYTVLFGVNCANSWDRHIVRSESWQESLLSMCALSSPSRSQTAVPPSAVGHQLHSEGHFGVSDILQLSFELAMTFLRIIMVRRLRKRWVTKTEIVCTRVCRKRTRSAVFIIRVHLTELHTLNYSYIKVELLARWAMAFRAFGL